MPKLRSFHDWLIESLKDPKEAEAYLKAALSENDPDLLRNVINDVIEAGNNSVVDSLKIPQNS
jgi:DNA-binding phage protein